MGDKRFYVPVLTAIAFGMFILLMRFLPELAAWPGWALCGGGNCTVQGWLGALSGWVAAAAAIVTLVVLVRQVEAQNRQIKFLLGENPPSAEHWSSGKYSTVVRITNWNRTKFVINAILVEAPIDIAVRSIDTRTRDLLLYHPIMRNGLSVRADGTLSRHITIEGWENQNEEPREVFLDLTFANGSPLDNRMASVRFVGHLSGRTRQKIDVSVSIPVCDLRIE